MTLSCVLYWQLVECTARFVHEIDGLFAADAHSSVVCQLKRVLDHDRRVRVLGRAGCLLGRTCGIPEEYQVNIYQYMSHPQRMRIS